VEDLQGIVVAMVQRLGALAPDGDGDPADLYRVGQNTTRLLMASGDVVIAWLLLGQAAVALDKLPSAQDPDRAFYQGKIAAAKFFAGSVLPLLACQRTIAERADPELMDIADGAF
jgi:hypothetical protein